MEKKQKRNDRCAALESEGHTLIARGHEKLAEAARLRTETGAVARPSWIPAAESPLGKRKTLALARAGALASSKIGRQVLVRRASLDALIEGGRRGDVADEEEDLFGVKAVAA